MQVKVDNIRRQAEGFVQMHEERQDDPLRPAHSRPSRLPRCRHGGVFESVGCTRIISGGPTMNPSTREIVEAVDACPSDDVTVLPNDKNIILAAEQAIGLTKKRLHVVGSRSMPRAYPHCSPSTLTMMSRQTSRPWKRRGRLCGQWK